MRGSDWKISYSDEAADSMLAALRPCVGFTIEIALMNGRQFTAELLMVTDTGLKVQRREGHSKAERFPVDVIESVHIY